MLLFLMSSNLIIIICVTQELSVASAPSDNMSAKAKAAATEPSNKKNDSNEETTQKTRASSFSYAWLMIYIVYKARNFFLARKNRQVCYDEDFFLKTGLNHKLEYGLEYEDDYSVDHSFYGSISNWDCEMHKFDLDDDHV